MNSMDPPGMHGWSCNSWIPMTPMDLHDLRGLPMTLTYLLEHALRDCKPTKKRRRAVGSAVRLARRARPTDSSSAIAFSSVGAAAAGHVGARELSNMAFGAAIRFFNLQLLGANRKLISTLGIPRKFLGNLTNSYFYEFLGILTHS